MSSLAEDFTWYEQFKRAADAQPSPARNRAVISTQDPQGRQGSFSEILKWSLKIIRRRNVEDEELPSTESHNAPLASHHELNDLGTANREFTLKLLEWNRGKMVRSI
jgi:hypothetical protein